MWMRKCNFTRSILSSISHISSEVCCDLSISSIKSISEVWSNCWCSQIYLLIFKNIEYCCSIECSVCTRQEFNFCIIFWWRNLSRIFDDIRTINICYIECCRSWVSYLISKVYGDFSVVFYSTSIDKRIIRILSPSCWGTSKRLTHCKC